MVDEYFTPPEIVVRCGKLIKKHIKYLDRSLIVEPSAGNGAFIPLIKSFSNNYKCYDIKPQHSDVIKQDFLNLSISNWQWQDVSKQRVVIGNPPFSLSCQFIKKCCNPLPKGIECDYLCFILPRSYMKETKMKQIPRNYHLLAQEKIDFPMPIVKGKLPSIRCVFQIWEQREDYRPKLTMPVPNGFEILPKDEWNKADVAFIVKMNRAGQILFDKELFKKFGGLDGRYVFFIKFIKKFNLDKIEFPEMENCIIPNISKREIIDALNRIVITKNFSL